MPEPADYCIVSRHGAGRIARRQRWMSFGLVALASVVVAASLAMAGAWPVLPYSALELVLVGLAFATVERRARDWERLTVAGDRVVLERSRRGRRERREFNRLWLRVEVDQAGRAREPRLTLRFAGEAMDFGGALPPGRRVEVAKTLRRLTADA